MDVLDMTGWEMECTDNGLFVVARCRMQVSGVTASIQDQILAAKRIRFKTAAPGCWFSIENPEVGIHDDGTLVAKGKLTEEWEEVE